MKNAESIMAAFFNCRLVEKNNLFTKTLFNHLLLVNMFNALLQNCNALIHQ